MSRTVTNILFYIISSALAVPAILPFGAASASTLEQQRESFRQARKELRAGRIESFNKIAQQLQDYPLYPYLQFDYLSRYVWKVKDNQLVSFLDNYPDLPVAGDLRRTWLNYLARRGRWQAFIDNYTTLNDELLQCYYLHARLMANRPDYLLEDTRSMWLYGKSRPQQCDQPFAQLYNSDLMNDELLWQRIRLAMAEGQTSLAGYLGRKLRDQDRVWVERWVTMHNNPWKWTAHPGFEDRPEAREILVYGIQRLAPRDINKAIEHWRHLQERYSFDPEQIRKIRNRLAVIAARKDHEDAVNLLDQINPADLDENIFQWRIATALKNRDWRMLLKWTSGDPVDKTLSQRWYYWHARALEETGVRDQAEAIFRNLSRERDYYGFAASDRLGMSYDMRHRAVPEDAATMKELLARPALVRTHELLQLNMNYYARREWYAATSNMSLHQMQMAAAIAYQWGWFDRAILTMGKAQAYDDLMLRFPMPFQREITRYASEFKLDLAWTFALIRAESAFMEDALSPSGAMGLMQVMPATGRETAQAMGWKSFDAGDLNQAEKNIPIGATYLRKMYDRFGSNIILATAAYNAGPGNVAAWLPRKGCMEPEIWIEQIPFDETRKYVSRILYFASIYDWRLQHEIKPVRQRMALVAAHSTQKVADLSCSSAAVSMR
jgi:soluble lytic murein transglycosylase